LFGDRFSDRQWRGDLFGGVTTAVVSLPLALAFGVASGAGAQAGLWGATLVGLFAALFGGSRTLISEPTGPMTVIMTAVLTSMLARYPDQGLAMAFTVVMMAGVFQIILGYLKLGRYITMMPYSVISGFMSGIGVILIIIQLAPFMGHPSPAGGVIGTLRALPDLLMKIEPREFIVGSCTLAILFLMPKKWRRSIPPQLLALVVMTVASILLFGDNGIRRIGMIPQGFPEMQFPTFSAETLMTMVLDAMVLGTLGCIDTLLTAVIGDSLTRQEHDSNRELIGQGIANTISGLFGALPGAGATMGTVVNIQVGARSPVAGIARALILMTVVLGASTLTSPIPLAVLAAIAMHVGFNILDWSFLKRAHRVSRVTTFIMYGVMILTVFVDLIVAVGLGVFIANIITIERLSRLQERNVKTISDAGDDVPLNDEERNWLNKSEGKVLYFYLYGPMIFGVSKAIARQHAAIKNYSAMILDVSEVPMLDTSVMLSLENAVKDANEAGCEVFIYCPNEHARKRFENFGIDKLIDKEHFVDSRLTSLKKAYEAVQEKA
jgi:SulP family sulfate permease